MRMFLQFLEAYLIRVADELTELAVTLADGLAGLDGLLAGALVGRTAEGACLPMDSLVRAC